MTARILQLSAFTIGLIFHFNQARSQESDTLKHQFDEVVITGYLSNHPLVQVPASAAVLDSGVLKNGSQQSLLLVLNTVPGIRMEERSPGSYRLSIRGSLLRSPFGVRNVKMYLNDLPFTDASGNTYLNLIDPALLQRIEILKGPDGSLFGANSGGVVLLDSHLYDPLPVEGSVSGGSYGLFREHALVSVASKNISWNFGEGFQRSNGYREQSAMRRLNLVGSGNLKYGRFNTVKVTALFSDIHYETPGGLTLNQFQDKPEQARPAAGVVPGAVEQQSGVYNTTFFGGITNELKLASSIRHVISFFGTFTDFENPFITNYETRTEKNAGLRTYIEYAFRAKLIDLRIHAGIEDQFGFQKISNYENNEGKQGQLKISDEIDIYQGVYFSKLSMEVASRLLTELSFSFNQYRFGFNESGSRKLSNEWMPRLAVSYRLNPCFALRASMSKGYSPPTIAEIRPSGGVINETLNAESGWSKEVGARLSIWNGRVQTDASVFRYDLSDAIVRRTDENDAEYFLNSGSTTQNGVEIVLNTVIIPVQRSGFVRSMSVQLSYTYSDFKFDNYIMGTENYSGNRLTGVPESNAAAGLSAYLAQRVYFSIQSIFASRIPLNDANSEYAHHYELLQAKLGWIGVKNDNLMLEFFLGADNILNQRYSLGNDINAYGGRYFNAAPLRNFYGGVTAKFW